MAVAPGNERGRSSLSRWEHWWFPEAPPHALALFRIVLGTFLLLYWGVYLPYVPLLFSDVGLAMPVADALDGWPAWLLQLIQPPSWHVAYAIVVLFLGAFLCIAVGLWFRVRLRAGPSAVHVQCGLLRNIGRGSRWSSSPSSS